MKNDFIIRAETDVVIVGAGPVGLAFANLLQAYGLRFALFTQESEPRPVYESRAEGVHVRTLELFERIGVNQRAMDQGRPLEGVSLYSLKQKLGSFSLKDPRSEFPGALILEQGKVERILAERLLENGAPIHWGQKLTALVQKNDGVEAQFIDQNGATLRLDGKYFVGCDGAHSTTRKLIGIDFIGEPHPGSYALADVNIEWNQEELDSNVHVFMSPLLLFGKLKEGSWKVASLVPKGTKLPESPEEILSILQAQIDHHGVLAKLLNARWTSHFRISNRHVSIMRKDRVFLAGDAAHIHSPMGGQGMNEGIHDAANLAWKLALVVKGKADDSLLDTYSEERLPLIEKVLKDTAFMTNAIEMEGPARWVRDQVASVATQLQIFEPLLREEFSGAHRTIGQSRIIKESNVSFLQHIEAHSHGDIHPNPLDELAFAQGPKPGSRAPNPAGLLSSPRDPIQSLNQILTGDFRHTLLVFEGRLKSRNFEKSLEESQRCIANYEDTIRLLVVTPEQTGHLQRIFDSANKAHDSFGARTSCAYVIRPDGFIGFRSLMLNSRVIAEYLESFLVSRS